MRRALQVYKVFFRSSLSRELEFRANFLAKMAMNFVWCGFFLVTLLVIFNRTQTVAGWTREQAFVLASSVFLMESVMRAFFFSLAEIPTMVRTGALDAILTKPIDSQFWVSTRKFSFEQIGSMISGIGLISYAAYAGGLKPAPVDVAAYLVLLLASLVIFYSFLLALMTLGIYFVKVENLWVLGETVLDISRYPTDIYSIGLQRIFLFAAPLSFLATVPARQLLHGFDPPMVGLGLAWAGGLFVLSRWFWKFSSRRYSSASS